MRNENKRVGRHLIGLVLVLTLGLNACGSSDANSTPTMSVDAIFTAAYQTIQAQEATQLALTPPTSTPSPTPFPTLPPPTAAATISFASSTPPVGGVGSACDNAAYVSDVSIPDGTTLKPGEKFTKTWRLFNSGSCAWTTGYKLAFDSGEAMGGAATVLAAQVPSGSQTDISVAMTAPSTSGTYKGNWRMQNAGGQPFGNVVYVEIKVGGPAASATAGPSPTASSTVQAGMITIAGNAERPDTVIAYAGKNDNYASGQVTADGSGNYAFTVPSGWRGTVTPSKGTYVFTPSSRTYDGIFNSLWNENYDAI